MCDENDNKKLIDFVNNLFDYKGKKFNYLFVDNDIYFKG